jgi:succinate dehydrogenase / fumarate reductase iron-sulfur subunit
MPISPATQERAMDAAICIGCGACVAACPNSAAMLFTGAKVTHLNLLPQGQPERRDRTLRMVEAMDAEGFGGCTNHGECARSCPQEISLDVIGMLNREYRRALRGKDAAPDHARPGMVAQ